MAFAVAGQSPVQLHEHSSWAIVKSLSERTYHGMRERGTFGIIVYIHAPALTSQILHFYAKNKVRLITKKKQNSNKDEPLSNPVSKLFTGVIQIAQLIQVLRVGFA